jgi:SAM-dependent methyltransferase
MDTTHPFLIESDPWLDRWHPLLREAGPQPRLLELGCSAGRDTAWLTHRGYRPVSLDISAEALEQCARNAPQASLLRHDLQDPLPFPDAHFEIVLAALCLHYFEWRKTLEIAADIRRCMAPGALLLCRLNSTRDFHHGAAGHDRIEPDYYRIDGRYSSKKRFFDRAAVEALFAEGWEFLVLEERTIDRYDKPKAIWEMALRKR